MVRASERERERERERQERTTMQGRNSNTQHSLYNPIHKDVILMGRFFLIYQADSKMTLMSLFSYELFKQKNHWFESDI